MNCRENKLSSTPMRLSCLTIPSSLFNVLVCCLGFMFIPNLAAASSLRGNDTDRLALLAFKANIIEDPFRVLNSWNGSIHFCQWHGVICGRRHQRVTMLNLSSQKLFGPIPPHIGNLTFLRILRLENNSFVHEIPPELGRLRRLQLLSLQNNSLNGKIPANLSGCSNLVVFQCNFNSLVGEIPVELGFLSKLQNIHLRLNDLTGHIPYSLANLTSLERLDITRNNISGSIPDALGQLINLKYLQLGGNRLSGTFPPSIFNLSSLEVIDVLNNHIHGSLPSYIGIILPNLQFLGFNNNQFSGSIPNSISNASNLQVFQIDGNKFTGKVPTFENLHKLQNIQIGVNSLGNGGPGDLDFLSSLTNATDLRVLAVGSNEFVSTLPESISNLSTKLEYFFLIDNYIVGSIPTGIGNLINLNILAISGNQLTGEVPNEIGKLYKLNRLYFYGNKLNGSIPFSVGNLSLLTTVSFEENKFWGDIPSSMGNWQNLLALNLSNNNLSGTIPPQVIGIPSLSGYLDLSRNHLSGSLPMEVGNLRTLGVLDVSENLLSGEIPHTLGSCVSLEILSMQGNSFQGSIPSSLSSLIGIQNLDLSRNNLTGIIPEYLAGFALKNLNLSFNDFDGEIPINGIFNNASATSVMGNSKLCGGALEFHLPRCKFKGSKKISSALMLKLIIPVSCGLLGLILVVCFFFLCRVRKQRNEASSGLPPNSLLKVSYQSLLKATNGFSSDNLIGAGSFGSVYKGILGQDETVVAVKVLNLSHHGAFKSFLAECETLRNTRHRNLVKVLTACSGIDYRGNDFKAIVYEFMVNGNLDEWLHPIEGEYEANKEARNLSILQRLNISIDVASVLDYLHNHCQPPIIHCDLKPSNILLDKEMTARVGDFGLARFLINARYSNSSHQISSSIGLGGSIGYTAPEYGMGSEVSRNGDVYSYGVLILEMFTGKRPVDEMFKDNMNLHNFVKMALQGGAAEDIVDPVLLQHEAKEGECLILNIQSTDQKHGGSHKIHECLISIFKIGIACSEETPSQRLDISEVVVELKVIRDKFMEKWIWNL